ncbi:Meiosis-specific serine/threonine-protein kinase mek1, partial [Tulasnella sp. 427]
HIFLELCTGGDLLQFIEDRGQVGDGEAKYIGLQLMKALNYLHSRKISHRDLKPENVLIHAPGAYPRIMLADFGFAKDNSFERTRSLAGTVSYVPPEALSVLFGYELGSQVPNFDGRRGYEGMPFDCWSLGVCLYFMISGRHPFDYGYGSAENSFASRYEDHAPAPTDKPSYWTSPWASFEIDIPSRQGSPPNRSDESSPPARYLTKADYPSSNDALNKRTLDRDATLKPLQPREQPGWEHYSFGEAHQDSMRSTGGVQELKVADTKFFAKEFLADEPLVSRPSIAKHLISKLLDSNSKSRLTIAGSLKSNWIVKDLDAMRKMYEKRIGPF